MRESKDENKEKFPHLEEVIRDRKHYLVLDALRILADKPENNNKEGFWQKQISKVLKEKHSISFKERYISKILKKLIEFDVVKKEQGIGYYIPEEIIDVLEDIHDAFEKAKRLGGNSALGKHYQLSSLYDIKPAEFFTPELFIRITEKMKEVGFISQFLDGGRKNETWDWTFLNTQYNLVEIEVAFAELDKEDITKVFGRSEEWAVLVEIHIHVRETHRIFRDTEFKVKDLKGKTHLNTSFMLYGNTSRPEQEKSLRNYCSHLAHTTLVQVNDILRDKYFDIMVMTMKSGKKEVLIEEEWEDEEGG